MNSEFNQMQFGMRVKRLRAAKQLSILRLSELAEVNKNTICNIEKGENNTTIEVACRIAKALDVDLISLFDTKPTKGIDYLHFSGDLIEQEIPPQIAVRDKRSTIAALPTRTLKDVGLKGGSVIAGIIEVSEGREAKLGCHDGEELFFCLTGKILVNINGKKIELLKGDCILFWGSDPHSYQNIREDDNSLKSVGLSVIADSKCESFTALYEKTQLWEG